MRARGVVRCLSRHTAVAPASMPTQSLHGCSSLVLARSAGAPLRARVAPTRALSTVPAPPSETAGAAVDAAAESLRDPLADLDAALSNLEAREAGIAQGAAKPADDASEGACDYSAVEFYEISPADARRYLPEGLAGAAEQEYEVLGNRVARHGVIAREPALTVLRSMQALQEGWEAARGGGEGKDAGGGGRAAEISGVVGASVAPEGETNGDVAAGSADVGATNRQPRGGKELPDEAGEELRRAFFLRGERGTGKSCALNHIVHYARTNGWLVLFVPAASRFLHRGKYIRPSKHVKGVFDMPVVAQQMLGHLLAAHDRAMLASILVKTPEARARYAGAAVPLNVGTPLPAELTLGTWARTGTVNPELWEELDRLSPDYNATAAAAAAAADAEAAARAAEAEDDEDWDDWLKETDEERAAREAAEAAAAANSSAAAGRVRTGDQKGGGGGDAKDTAPASDVTGGSGGSGAGRHPGTRLISAEGMTLLDVIEAGLARLDLASPAIWDVRREMGLCTEVPTLVVVDEYNSFSQPSDWQWATSEVRPHQLAVARPLMEFPLPGGEGRGGTIAGPAEHSWSLGEDSEVGDEAAVGRLVNGIVVCAISHTHPERRRPHFEQALEETLEPHSVFAGPYSNSEFAFAVQRMREGGLIEAEATAVDELMLRAKTAQVPGRVWSKCRGFTVGDSFTLRTKRAPRREGLRGNVLNC